MQELKFSSLTQCPDRVWVKSRYCLFSNDRVAGSLASGRRLCRQAGGFELRITDLMKVDISRLLDHYRLLSNEELLLDQQGLVRYRLTASEGNAESRVSMLRSDSEIQVQVQSRSGGSAKMHTLDKLSFDTVSETAAWLFLSSGAPTKTLKVLDLDDLEIREVSYRYDGRQTVSLAGHDFDCHLVRFESVNKMGSMKLVEDETGTWLCSETGHDCDGNYRVELVEYEYGKENGQ
ncbi:hypothetical protein [Nitrincola sp. MINF-07-Sa-05]|uniref:hypothetical protein n=1 Tax=Nitrincola salilacus TaxID=3400273 RepID=UPI00391823B4